MEDMSDSVMLDATETVLVGEWRLAGNLMQANATCVRIHALVSSYLVEIERADGGWAILYTDPGDGRLWELSYPSGQMHGGGPPVLAVVEPAAALTKFQVAL